MKAPWTLIETVPGERMVWSMAEALRSSRPLGLSASAPAAASETDAIATFMYCTSSFSSGKDPEHVRLVKLESASLKASEHYSLCPTKTLI